MFSLTFSTGKTEVQDLAGDVDVNSIVRGRFAPEAAPMSPPISQGPVGEEQPASR